MAEMGNDLKGAIGELRMRVEIKRAATGVVEKYDIVGYTALEPDPEPAQPEQKDD